MKATSVKNVIYKLYLYKYICINLTLTKSINFGFVKTFIHIPELKLNLVHPTLTCSYLLYSGVIKAKQWG